MEGLPMTLTAATPSAAHLRGAVGPTGTTVAQPTPGQRSTVAAACAGAFAVAQVESNHSRCGLWFSKKDYGQKLPKEYPEIMPKLFWQYPKLIGPWLTIARHPKVCVALDLDASKPWPVKRCLPTSPCVRLVVGCHELLGLETDCFQHVQLSEMDEQIWKMWFKPNVSMQHVQLRLTLPFWWIGQGSRKA